MGMVRSFIAIPTPVEIAHDLRESIASLRDADAEVRWEPVEKIHITLRFLGDVDEVLLPRLIKDCVDSCCNQKSFSLLYGGFGCFPNNRDPRIIWLGSENGDGLLEPLKKIIDETVNRYGFVPENRPFRPHLTLGRVKGKRNIRNLIKMLQSVTFEPRTVVIDELVFMKSELRPTGSIYTKLQSIRLST